MGKKKGGGKKKKGGGKKKEEVTWGEALMAYKINIKEKELEDIRYEVRALEEKNERHKERNERLLEEQEHYMNLLLKQAREFELKLSQEKPTERDAVLKVLHDKWNSARDQEQLVAGLKEQIAKTELEIMKEEGQVSTWTEYREKGHKLHATQMNVLEKELQDLQQNFQHMSVYISTKLENAKESISQHVDQMMDQQKYKASERAIAMMDKNSRQEVVDNEWLQHEADIHGEDVAQLEEQVQSLEHENLQILAELFDCSVDQLKINKNTFLTQCEDGENLEEHSLLEIDMNQLSLNKKQQMLSLEAADDARPASATFLAISRKFEKIQTQEDDAESIFEGELKKENDPFGTYMNYEDDAFEDYLRLGPVELKLLSIEGESMTLHKVQPPSAEELAALDCNPEEWPVTVQAVRRVLAT